MSKWQFFELDRDKTVIPLSGSSLNIAPYLTNVLEAAAVSKVPDPKFSKYYVNCACLIIDTVTNSEIFSLVARVPGGNIEYGLCQALHGEESLVAAVSSRLSELGRTGDRGIYDVFIAFASRSETGKVPTCCGNCRDIMRDNFPHNARIFSGHPNGGKVIASRLSDLLVDDFGPSNLNSPDRIIRAAVRNTIERGPYLENDIYFPGQPHLRRKYYASIAGADTVFYGAHDVMCDYHPIYAIRDAVRQARRHNKPHFDYVVVVGRDDGSDLPPDVMYKDRQHLLELNFQQECLIGHKVDPSVYLAIYELVGTDNHPRVKGYWETTVKRWLPYPFSPAAFGEEFVRYATDRFSSK